VAHTPEFRREAIRLYLVELGQVGQRHKAVLEVLSDASVAAPVPRDVSRDWLNGQVHNSAPGRSRDPDASLCSHQENHSAFRRDRRAR
jgi:hypothetical protein